MYRAVCIAVFWVGLIVPAGVIDSGLAALLVTFFGLLAAGIIPAMSLLVGGVLSPSRSVARVISLKGDLDLLLQRLAGTLATIIVGALTVMLVSTGQFTLTIPHETLAPIPSIVREGLSTLPNRLLQASSFLCLFLSLDRLRVVNEAFKAALNARFELTLEEAQRELRDRAPTAADVASAFPTQSGFGSRAPMGTSDKSS